ncbi:hypothetical protein SDC9_173660 [bioreactor metagenome]|uniref:Uncharacterized protein n=1 Tax=bioreactor metagenome TaxID=1076179 RepID=A0A645GJ20_9ZZZZ
MRKCAVKKPRVFEHVRKERVPVGGVGDVAAAFSGDVEFLAELFIAFKERYVVPVLRRAHRGDHARGAAADDENNHVRSSLSVSDR